MKKYMLLFWLLSALAVHAFSQQTSPPAFVRDSLDGYVERSMRNWEVPGLAVCIVKDGQVLLMKGFGNKTLGGQDPVDENTLFMIGSNTKAFTATALALLADEKKISLDDKVTKWIPEFKLENKAAGEQAIIRDLLCHRIGFMTFQGDFTYWTSTLSRKEVIEKMAHIRAHYPFRSTYGYTNAAFVTAGEIIPRATGMSWEEFVRRRIFEPLGMTRTLALSKDLAGASNQATPHTYADNKLVAIPVCAIDNLGPAGSISSSVNDLSKWVLMQLGNGSLDGRAVIPASVIKEIRKPHTIVSDGPPLYNTGHFELYGLGFFLQDYQGRKIVSHTGGVNGFVSSVTLVPEEKLGIIVLTNTDHNALYEALKWEILDAYLGLPYRNYSNVYLGMVKAQNLAGQKSDKMLMDSAALGLAPGLPLQAYTGDFVNEVYGKMSVALEGGELRMHFSHHPGMYGGLQSLGNHRFYVRFSDPEFGKAVFPFTVEKGKVKSVRVKVADFIEYDPYVFVKTSP